ncbi:MAG: DUF4384 domain-containing protein [Bacteroidia bacterium]|nr:DUF4384 domain-containing protein [Bacteroidia bacterium]
MKRIIITLATALALLPTLFAGAAIGSVSSIGPLRAGDYGIAVDLWTDRGQNEVYYPGDPIAVYFRASDDCFITIYSIGTEGDVSIIFPEFPDDGFVYGGVTYKLPEYYSGMRLRIAGPRGVEYLHAVATRDPGAFLYTSHRGRWRTGISPVVGDPFLAINAINGRLISVQHIAATATVSYFVGGRVWYPRYACYDCHARSPRFDPYDLSCSRYTVSIATHYDYWWAYNYHPVRTHFVFGGPFWKFTIRTHPPHRRPHYRYVDFAYGHWNYIPLRPIHRPHHRVVYRPGRISTYKSWERSYTRVRSNDTWDRRTRDPRMEYRSRDYTVSRSDGTAIRGISSSGGRSRVDSERDRIGTDRGNTRSRDAASDIRDRGRTTDTPSSGVNSSAASGVSRERNRETSRDVFPDVKPTTDTRRDRERTSPDRLTPPIQNRESEAEHNRSTTSTRERAVQSTRPANEVRDDGRLSPPVQERDAQIRQTQNAETAQRRAAEELRQREAEASQRREAETARQRAAEASQRREADAARQREAEASQRREAEAARQRAAEASQRREADAARQREAEASQRREAEAARQREAEASQRREAETARQRAAEASQRREAEAARQREAEASQRREAEAARQRRAEASQRREADAARQREAEASQRREADAARQREAEASQRREAEAARQREAEASQRREADAARQRETEASQRREAEAARMRYTAPVQDRANGAATPTMTMRGREQLLDDGNAGMRSRSTDASRSSNPSVDRSSGRSERSQGNAAIPGRAPSSPRRSDDGRSRAR